MMVRFMDFPTATATTMRESWARLMITFLPAGPVRWAAWRDLNDPLTPALAEGLFRLTVTAT